MPDHQLLYNSIFRIGGDEIAAFSESADEAGFREKVPRITNEVEACGYSTSSGIAACRNETGLARAVKDADTLMLENKRKCYAEYDHKRV